ncbi:hypothetical protein [Synechococcus sp. M16CYN]|uniref:hypothetical protein n=1 Tax=Synechococcus sp. M16CYN TaxID=3103139 RepID=UPI0033403C78
MNDGCSLGMIAKFDLYGLGYSCLVSHLGSLKTHLSLPAHCTGIPSKLGVDQGPATFIR